MSKVYSVSPRSVTLRDEKAELRRQLRALTLGFIARGGRITVCRPGVARGAEFSRNQHPKNGLMGVTAPTQFG